MGNLSHPGSAAPATSVVAPIEAALPSVIERIVRALHPEKIVLFGSYARGEQTPNSDVDLLVVMHTDWPQARRALAVTHVLAPQPFQLDIVVRTPDEIDHAYQRKDMFVPRIMAEGRVLYDAGRTPLAYPEDGALMRVPPDIAEWLLIADQDLQVARSLMRYKTPPTRIAGFHAQQCVEKYLKAVLVARGAAITKTHNLHTLFDACLAAGASLNLDRPQLELLPAYAVQARYPGSELTNEEAREAISIAAKARRTLRKALGL